MVKVNFLFKFFKHSYLLRLRLFKRLSRFIVIKALKNKVFIKKAVEKQYNLYNKLNRFLVYFYLKYSFVKFIFKFNAFYVSLKLLYRLKFLNFLISFIFKNQKNFHVKHLNYKYGTWFMKKFYASISRGRFGFLQRYGRSLQHRFPLPKKLISLPLAYSAEKYLGNFNFLYKYDSVVGSSFGEALYYRKEYFRYLKTLSYYRVGIYKKIKLNEKRRFIFISNFLSLYSNCHLFFFSNSNYNNIFSFIDVLSLLKKRFFRQYGSLYSKFYIKKIFSSYLEKNLLVLFNHVLNYEERLRIEREFYNNLLKKFNFFYNNDFQEFYVTPNFEDHVFNHSFIKPFSFFSKLFLGNPKNLRFSSSGFSFKFLNLFLLHRSYTLSLSNYSALSDITYNVSNNYRMHKALSFFFLQNDLFFSPRNDFIVRDGVKLDPLTNKIVFKLDKVNFSKNSFFKSLLVKYKKIYLYTSSLNVKLLIQLLPSKKLKLKFIFDRYFFSIQKMGSFRILRYKLFKKMFVNEIRKIQYNNVFSNNYKILLLTKLKNWFYLICKKNKFISFRSNTYNYYSRIFFVAKKSIANVGFLLNKPIYLENTILRNTAPLLKVNYYFMNYSLVHANLKYFFTSNFHLGFQRNRWDPNFVHYYWGVRRNYMILNLNRTWLNFKILAFNIWDCVNYRLPVLFVNQNRLIDLYVCKAFHSLGLLNSVAISGYRWLGGTLSNIKDVCGINPGFNKSAYKVSINLMSTKYIRTSHSLFPIGISLNNIKNYWFINELRNINVKSHSVVDSNGMLIYPENVIAGNSFSLSSNAFFLSICRLVVDSCLRKERLNFSIPRLIDTIPDDTSQKVKDHLYVRAHDPVLEKKLFKFYSRSGDSVRSFYRDHRFLKRSLYKKVKPQIKSVIVKKFKRTILLKSKYFKNNNFFRKLRSYNLKQLHDVKFSLRFNKSILKKMSGSLFSSVQRINYMKGAGTFFSYLKKAKFNENQRNALLVARGFMEYLPTSLYERVLLRYSFSTTMKLKNAYVFDYIEYILYNYIQKVKNYRKSVKVFKK